MRAILNFGHTVGHALEAITAYRRLLHGEAVAIGMVVATMLSVRRGLCEQDDLLRLRSLLERIGLPTRLSANVRSLLKTMNYDKKVKNQVIYFVLTKGIGHVTLAAISESDELKEVLAAAGWPS